MQASAVRHRVTAAASAAAMPACAAMASPVETGGRPHRGERPVAERAARRPHEDAADHAEQDAGEMPPSPATTEPPSRAVNRRATARPATSPASTGTAWEAKASRGTAWVSGSAANSGSAGTEPSVTPCTETSVPLPTVKPGPAARPSTAAAALGRSSTQSPSRPSAPAPAPPSPPDTAAYPSASAASATATTARQRASAVSRPARTPRSTGRVWVGSRSRTESTRPDSLPTPQPAAATASSALPSSAREQTHTGAGAVGHERQQGGEDDVRAGEDAGSPERGPRAGGADGADDDAARTREAPRDAQGQQQRGDGDRPGGHREVRALGEQPEPPGQQHRSADPGPTGRIEGGDHADGQGQDREPRRRHRGGRGERRPHHREGPGPVAAVPTRAGQACEQGDHGPHSAKVAPPVVGARARRARQSDEGRRQDAVDPRRTVLRNRQAVPSGRPGAAGGGPCCP